MNKKGFTLVELLAVIVIVALVLAITIPTSIVAYKNAKLRTEDVFVKRLSEVIEDYVSLGSQDLLDYEFTTTPVEPSAGKKFTKTVVSIDSTPATAYKVYEVKKAGGGDIKIGDLISEGLLFEAKYVNPNNKNTECLKEAKIEVYKDSDSVYCHKVLANSLGCLTDDYKELITKEQTNINLQNMRNKRRVATSKKDEVAEGFNNLYAINTCVWYEE